MSTPAERDPQHEMLYLAHCADQSLNHAGLLKLLEPDAFRQEGLHILVTPEGQEQGIQPQLQYDTIKALDFLASTLYRRAIPTLKPESKLPAVFSPEAIRTSVKDRQAAIYDDGRDGPISALTRGMGTPRIQNPRLEALDPTDYVHRRFRNDRTVHSMALLAFKAEVRRGAHPAFTAVVECPIYITEAADNTTTGPKGGFVRVSRQYKRTAATKSKLHSQRLAVRAPKMQ